MVDIADGASYAPNAARPWLPGEHGFRFFPNFYKHVTDTMSRIPTQRFPGGSKLRNPLLVAAMLWYQFRDMI